MTKLNGSQIILRKTHSSKLRLLCVCLKNIFGVNEFQQLHTGIKKTLRQFSLS